MRRSPTDPRFLKLGIRPENSKEAGFIFHSLYFPSVFKLFQFFEAIEIAKQPYLCDFRLIQREIKQDAALVALLKSGLNYEQAKQTWNEQLGLTKQDSEGEEEILDIGDVGGSHRGSAKKLK